jgi:hypothetical protein
LERQTLIAGAIAVFLVGGVVGGILFSTRKNRVELTGKVLQVRSHMIDPENTVAVIDFRISNPSTQQFVVREVEVFLDKADGAPMDGAVFAEIDAQRAFQYYPVLGKKYNATLVLRDKIEPGQSVDRMILVRFSAPDELVRGRKAIRILIKDVDGPRSEIREQRS